MPRENLVSNLFPTSNYRLDALVHIWWPVRSTETCAGGDKRSNYYELAFRSINYVWEIPRSYERTIDWLPGDTTNWWTMDGNIPWIRVELIVFHGFWDLFSTTLSMPNNWMQENKYEIDLIGSSTELSKQINSAHLGSLNPNMFAKFLTVHFFFWSISHERTVHRFWIVLLVLGER